MRTIILLMINLTIFGAADLFAQHIPPCQGNAHSTSICWGYATGRAFGRSWNDSRCPLNTLYFTGISTTLFHFNEGASLSGISAGDIVVFGAVHAAYVRTPHSNPLDFKVDQVPNINGPEQTNVSLSDAIDDYGQPTGYYREKKLWSVTVQNSFTGGKVGVNGTEWDSPYTESELYWESTFNIDAVMDGRLHDNYIRRFVKWLQDDGSDYNTSKSTTITITKYNFSEPEDYTAIFRKEFNITFQNNFIGVGGNAGIIKVNGQQYTLPTSQPFQVVEPNSITAEAISGQVYNYIIYAFTQWSDGNTSYSRTFTPTDHTTYIANTDYEYVITGGYTHDLVQYDVRAYYSNEGSFADPNYVSAFGRLDVKIMAGDAIN